MRKREEARERVAAAAQTAGCGMRNGQSREEAGPFAQEGRARQDAVMMPPLHGLLAANEEEGGRGCRAACALAKRSSGDTGPGRASPQCRPYPRRRVGPSLGPVIGLWAVLGRTPALRLRGKWRVSRQPRERVSKSIGLIHFGVTKRCAGPSRD